MEHQITAARLAQASDTNIEPRETVVAVVDGVAKSIRGRTIVTDLCMTVRAREVLAIVGPIGSGKTLLVNLLVGQCIPDAGTVRVFGSDPCDPNARAAFGVMPQEISFPNSLRVREIVALVQAHYVFAIPGAELILRFGLCPIAEKRAGQLTSLERRRLAFALTFAGNPEMIVLDDPIGDPVPGWDSADVWPLLRRYADQGGAIVLTACAESDINGIADRVIRLDVDGLEESPLSATQGRDVCLR